MKKCHKSLLPLTLRTGRPERKKVGVILATSRFGLVEGFGSVLNIGGVATGLPLQETLGKAIANMARDGYETDREAMMIDCDSISEDWNRAVAREEESRELVG